MSLKTNKSYRFIAAPAVVLALGLPAMVNCGDAASALEGCDEFSAEADFGGRLDIDVRVKSFMRAAGSFKVLGEAMVADVSGACVNIAKAAGRAESAWAGKEGTDLVEAACAEASAGIDAVFKAAGMLSINILVEGGRCEASLEASAACNAQCDVNGTCTPGELEAKCEPGQLAGSCSAECTGACEANVGASVECKGSCSAVCNGDCAGDCDVKGAGGKCAGRCSGTCNGTCSGSCELEANAKVQCEGTCRGGCSVEFTAPHCEGKFEPPMCKVDADCSANCNASVQAEAKCTPPKVTYEIVGGVSTAELTTLVNALQVELPKLLVNAVDRGQAIADSAAAMEASAEGVVDAAGSSGKAFVCATAAASAALTASVNVSVSFQASASVSGKASGGT
jgi:hypothetical protein